MALIRDGSRVGPVAVWAQECGLVESGEVAAFGLNSQRQYPHMQDSMARSIADRYAKVSKAASRSARVRLLIRWINTGYVLS